MTAGRAAEGGVAAAKCQRLCCICTRHIPTQIRAHLFDVKQIIGLAAKSLGHVGAHFMALALKFN